MGRQSRSGSNVTRKRRTGSLSSVRNRDIFSGFSGRTLLVSGRASIMAWLRVTDHI
jgi:hypothetical protein